jgi:hypothetical protein
VLPRETPGIQRDASRWALDDVLTGKGDFDEVWTSLASGRAYPGIDRDLFDLSLNHHDRACGTSSAPSRWLIDWQWCHGPSGSETGHSSSWPNQAHFE